MSEQLTGKDYDDLDALLDHLLDDVKAEEMMSKVTEQHTCQNCGHSTCHLHGENRKPVYNGAVGVFCWIPAVAAK